MINKGMYSSNTFMWETPKELFEKLNKEFNFDVDVCATKENAKCKKFYTPEENGLQQDWTGTCWMNPPYGKEISKWVKKAYESKATVVCLLPARTDTRWFHEYIYKKSEIRFIKGRIKFSNSKNYAPFPSMIVIFRNNYFV